LHLVGNVLLKTLRVSLGIVCTSLSDCGLSRPLLARRVPARWGERSGIARDRRDERTRVIDQSADRRPGVGEPVGEGEKIGCCGDESKVCLLAFA
jgi:hypothetical protein